MAAKHNYTEDSIKTLSALEHIRLRPGMYIGRLGNGVQNWGNEYSLPWQPFIFALY